MNRSGFALLLVLTVLLNGCQQEGTAIQASKRSAWREHVMKTRMEKDREFAKDPMSPMAAIDWFELIGNGPHGLRTDDETIMHTPVDQAEWLLNEDESGVWHLQKPGGDERTVDSGQAIPLNDRFTVVCYVIDGGIQVRVFDQDRPELRSFSSLRYYEPDTAYAVQARVERLSEPTPLKMVTSRNVEKSYFRVARLHFRLDGNDLVLAAYKMSLDGPYSDMYFVPFRDATSGSETYGAGRFLELPEPSGNAMLLDLNLAFNPLCNYSPAYNCPLPPAENTLLVPIEAGERTYPINH